MRMKTGFSAASQKTMTRCKNCQELMGGGLGWLVVAAV